MAVFRDELINLFPMDEDARRLLGQHLPAQRVPRAEGLPFPRSQTPSQGPGAEALPS